MFCFSNDSISHLVIRLVKSRWEHLKFQSRPDTTISTNLLYTSWHLLMWTLLTPMWNQWKYENVLTDVSFFSSSRLQVSSRTKSFAYGLFWKQNRKDCRAYLSMDTKLSRDAHMRWVDCQVQNLESYRKGKFFCSLVWWEFPNSFMSRKNNFRWMDKSLFLDTKCYEQEYNNVGLHLSLSIIYSQPVVGTRTSTDKAENIWRDCVTVHVRYMYSLDIFVSPLESSKNVNWETTFWSCFIDYVKPVRKNYFVLHRRFIESQTDLIDNIPLTNAFSSCLSSLLLDWDDKYPSHVFTIHWWS